MNKKFIKLCGIILAMAMVLSITACSKSKDTEAAKTPPAEKKDLKLGCLAYSEPIIQWIKEGLAPLGYNVEVVMFDANQLPATALKDGDLDGIIANHRPWILTFNQQNNSDLEMVEPYYFYSFFAIYSTKYQALSDIPQNAKFAIPGDPTNLSRSMLILQKAGLITLKEKTGPFYTILDIKENPKKITFAETEITQTARSINDVDAVISPAYYVGAAGIDPKVYLFEDPQNKDYPLGLIVNKADLKAEWAKAAVEMLRTEEYRKKFNNQFQGKYTLFE